MDSICFFSGLISVARELRDAKTKDSESRLELATQLVKQAYSECPNLDLLIGAILSNPLYRCNTTVRCPYFEFIRANSTACATIYRKSRFIRFTGLLVNRSVCQDMSTFLIPALRVRVLSATIIQQDLVFRKLSCT